VVTALLGAAAGALVGLGIFLAVSALAGRTSELRPPRWPDRLRRATWANDRLLLRFAGALIAMIVVWLATGWPVGGMAAAVAGAAAPSMLAAKRHRTESLQRIEAIAGWAEQLRDVMAAADGIQSANAATAPLAPPAIRPQVRRLAEGLANRERLEPTLRRFADEVDHSLADMVVTSLLLAAERQGRLGALLGEVARSARETAAMRMRVEATRARTYVTTRLIVGLTVAMTAWLVLLRRDYMAPFDTAGGQVMLLVIAGVFLASGVAMQRMARPQEPPRLLAPSIGGER
jgi:Flp pilus assembly protein TadB